MNKTQFRKMIDRLYSAAQKKAKQNGRGKTNRILQEECAELIVAASKMLRDDVDKPVTELVVHYVEELIDVQIMLIEALTFFDQKELAAIVEKMVEVKTHNLNHLTQEKKDENAGH